MKRDLPKYKISIDPEFSEGEDLGIEMIAYTANPAIKQKGLAFANQDQPKLFFADKVKNRIVAPAMIPMEIYRCDDQEEYYVEFTEQEIEKIHSKFMKKFSNKNVFNLEHDSSNVVPAYILECWIVDNPTEDKAFSTYGLKVPKGTLMVTSQVTSPEVYTELVANEQTGYSIEGFLGLSLSEIINKNKQKEKQMEENKMMLPAGEYVMGDKCYVVAEDGTFEVKDLAPVDAEMAEEAPVTEEVVEEVKEELACEPKEEEMAEEVVEEEVVEEMAEELPTEEPIAAVVSYSKEEVDAKFDELYKMIADLKAEEVIEEVAPINEEVKLSIHDRFSEYVKFASKGL